VGAVCSLGLVEGLTAIYSGGLTLSDKITCQRRRWPRASSQMEKNFEKANIESSRGAM